MFSLFPLASTPPRIISCSLPPLHPLYPSLIPLTFQHTSPPPHYPQRSHCSERFLSPTYTLGRSRGGAAAPAPLIRAAADPRRKCRRPSDRRGTQPRLSRGGAGRDSSTCARSFALRQRRLIGVTTRSSRLPGARQRRRRRTDGEGGGAGSGRCRAAGGNMRDSTPGVTLVFEAMRSISRATDTRKWTAYASYTRPSPMWLS